MIDTAQTMRISGLFLALSAAALVGSGPLRAEEQLVAVPATIASCLVPGCDTTRFIADAIDGAERELRIQFADVTSAPIAAAIIRARQRGVDVAVLLDNSGPCQDGAADEIKAAGIPVAIDNGGRGRPDRVAVIDRDRVIEGSLDAAAPAMKHAENTNLVISSAVAEIYRAQWVVRASRSVPYVDKSHSCPANSRLADGDRARRPRRAVMALDPAPAIDRL